MLFNKCLPFVHHVKKTFVFMTPDVALGVTPVAAVTGSWFY